MEKETLKALKGSVEKWKKIERSTRALDKLARNCPLCCREKEHIFQNICDGCPVKRRTGLLDCNGTPFKKWWDHHWNIHTKRSEKNKWFSRVKDCPTCLKLATAERKFLESLLPKKGKK